MFIGKSLLTLSYAAVATVALAQTAAQAPKPEGTKPAAPKPAEEEVLQTPVFVKRFSLGVSLNVLGLAPMKEASTSQQVSDILQVNSNTLPKGNRIGYGAFVQLRASSRFAINVNGVLRRIKWEGTVDTFEGVDRPTTVQDDRRQTSVDEKTKARYFDIYATLRRYSRDHDEEGHRWFWELGPAFRQVNQITTELTTRRGNERNCCDVTPRVPANKWSKGFSAGFGGQFRDDFGLTVTPQVRYTRWMDRPFDNLSIRTMVNQVEGMVSIGF
ncbi:MAG: hypothetical protein JNK48_02270 [Bryobacterales bacterium]|nr:hypothetical protein [Bryobacterales bacterium]